MDESFTCHDCGKEYEYEGDPVVCWCNREKTRVVWPCTICGDPIQMAEICADCGATTEGDAVTPTWGKHRYTENDQ